MGAELLTQPVLLCSILEALVQNIKLPITCKIRVLEDTEETVKLVKMISKTGISALAVHCRTKLMKSDNTRAMWQYIRIIMDSVDIPVIVNGDVFAMEDILEIKQQSGYSTLSFIYSILIKSFTHTFIYLMIHSFILYIYSFTHSYIHSFILTIHTFRCLLIYAC